MHAPALKGATRAGAFSEVSISANVEDPPAELRY
jgi:hypothetical protein